jgi:hypothetical protein
MRTIIATRDRSESDVIELGFRAANAIAWENQADAESARNGIVLRAEQAEWARQS